jgi:hypothetical protein
MLYVIWKEIKILSISEIINLGLKSKEKYLQVFLHGMRSNEERPLKSTYESRN